MGKRRRRRGPPPPPPVPPADRTEPPHGWRASLGVIAAPGHPVWRVLLVLALHPLLTYATATNYDLGELSHDLGPVGALGVYEFVRVWKARKG